MSRIVQPWYSIQYDGTNGEHIAGTWCTGITFVSDTGTVLTYLDADGYPRDIQLDQWVVVSFPGASDPMLFTPAEYAERYYELPE